MATAITIVSFLFCTALVAVLTWYFTRNDDHSTSQGFFLAGRSLPYPLIAGSLLLTNLSTEQLVGLNGDAFLYGLCVMVWEVVAVIALVFMAWFFLPRFLKSGVSTVPEYLQLRFDRSTQVISNIIFLIAYVVILLPMILYSGAVGMVDILDLTTSLGAFNPTSSLDNRLFTIICLVIAVGLIGAIYALFGGLRTVAVSDTLNGVGLLVGGFLITGFALAQLGGDGGMTAGIEKIVADQSERLNSIGGPTTNVPFGTIFSGIFLLNLFYWTTNQQIIQRTFAASSLAEGQKGVLLTGALKLLGPIYLVLPGIIAYSLFIDSPMKAEAAYGSLVREVLPSWLNGFFAAAMLGAILSSFNSAVNSACTLFSLGIYKERFLPTATDTQVVRSGQIFGWIIVVLAMVGAPFLSEYQSIFGYLQKMNAIYFIPIFSVVVIGMLTRRVPAIAANIAMIAGVSIIAIGYFVYPFNLVVESLHNYSFVGVVFMWLIIFQLVMGEIYPRATEFVQVDVKAVDMTPWRFAKPAGCLLILAVIAIYVSFADFRTLQKEEVQDVVTEVQAATEQTSDRNLVVDTSMLGL